MPIKYYQITEKLAYDKIKVGNRLKWIRPIKKGFKTTNKDEDVEAWLDYIHETHLNTLDVNKHGTNAETIN